MQARPHTLRRRAGVVLRGCLRAVLVLSSLILPVQAQEIEWERIGGSAHLMDFYFAEDGTLYGVDRGGGERGALRFVSDEDTWESLYDRIFISIVVTEEGYLVAGDYFYTERSTDGGETWERVDDYRCDIDRADVGPHAGTLFCGTNFGVRYSEDSGATWAGATVGPDTPLPLCTTTVALESGEILTGCYGGILRSTNGGHHFEETPLFGRGQYDAYSFARLSDGRVLASVSSVEFNGGIWRSADGGATWTLAAGLDQVYFIVAVQDAEGNDVVYGVDRLGSLIRSGDAGETWESVGAVLPNDGTLEIYMLKTGPDGRLYASVTQAGPSADPEGLYRTVRPVFPVSAEESAEMLSGLGLGVYPNPARSSARVTLSVPEASDATVAVYDVLGREVAVLHDGPLAAGEHRLRFESSGLPAGVYLVRAEAAGTTRAVHFTLVR